MQRIRSRNASSVDARHEREPQLAGRQQPHQPDRVAPIGLDPITDALRDRPGRDDPHIDPTLLAARASPNPVGPAS